MKDIDLCKQLAAETALQKMFADRNLSICTIDKIADLLGRNRGGPAYDVLSTLHCVNYSDMPVALYERLPDLIVDALSQNGPKHDIESLFKKTSVIRAIVDQGSSRYRQVAE